MKRWSDDNIIAIAGKEWSAHSIVHKLQTDKYVQVKRIFLNKGLVSKKVKRRRITVVVQVIKNSIIEI